jgi:hypothetical protein
MSDSAGVSIRDCQRKDVEAILQLWRQGDATPSVTDNADDLPDWVQSLAMRRDAGRRRPTLE